MNNKLRVGWNFCIYMTHVVRTSTQLAYSYECKKSYFFFLFFYLMLAYLRGLGISEIRDFRGPIWMRLKNSCSFGDGQVPGTSHVATRPKHTCERRVCPSLSRPFAAGPASSLFVVVHSVLDIIRIPGTTVRLRGFSSFCSPIFYFCCRLVLQKKKTRYSSK